MGNEGISTDKLKKMLDCIQKPKDCKEPARGK